MTTQLEQLQQQIEELTQKAEALAAEEKAKAITEMNKLIQLHKIGPADLNFPGMGRTGKVAVKYRLRNNQWTGRGKQPKWVVEHLAKGGKLDDLLVH